MGNQTGLIDDSQAYLYLLPFSFIRIYPQEYRHNFINYTPADTLKPICYTEIEDPFIKPTINSRDLLLASQNEGSNKVQSFSA